jgi:hypothetical protein
LLDSQVSLGVAAAASPEYPSSCKRCFHNIAIDVARIVCV